MLYSAPYCAYSRKFLVYKNECTIIAHTSWTSLEVDFEEVHHITTYMKERSKEAKCEYVNIFREYANI